MSILRRAFASFKCRTGTEAVIDYASDSYTKCRQLFEASVLYGLTPPPRQLQERIVARYYPRYFASGRQIAREILSLVPGIQRRVLDFGCGSGRVTVAVAKLLPEARLPDVYQSTFHTPDYIRSEWGKYFEIVTIKERAIGWGNHDAVVCKTR